MSVVTVRGLNLSYNGRQVLHQVDLTVEPGEFLVIIGANGTGKTSLLKAMAGLVKAEGEVGILG
ncbi:MAG TPA: ATP-binding cassette domain-containing protein, partial [Desulfurivibrionaceae bacterium]|nr:ATP-binding cassette domain-containing protein [Desulfurivibrionaceae bacterium]